MTDDYQTSPPMIPSHHLQSSCFAGFSLAIDVSIFFASTQTHMQRHTHSCIWFLGGCHTPVLTGHSMHCFFFWTILGAWMKLSYWMAKETELLLKGRNLPPDMWEEYLCVCVRAYVHVRHMSSTGHTVQHPVMCCFCCGSASSCLPICLQTRAPQNTQEIGLC